MDQLLAVEQTSSGQLIHFHNEIARNNQEIVTLRRQKKEAEAALNDLQSSVITKQEQYEEQIGV